MGDPEVAHSSSVTFDLLPAAAAGATIAGAAGAFATFHHVLLRHADLSILAVRVHNDKRAVVGPEGAPTIINTYEIDPHCLECRVNDPLSRRDVLRAAAASAAVLAIPLPLFGCVPDSRSENRAALDPSLDEDRARLTSWTAKLRAEQLTRADVSAGRSATRVGELAVGTPYVAFTLEEYLRAGGDPTTTEPLTLSLTKFDCVSLVESCLAVSRVADDQAAPAWDRFGREMERMRYRDGERRDYASRLHYFSEWISDGARRGLLRDLGGSSVASRTGDRCGS